MFILATPKKNSNKNDPNQKNKGNKNKMRDSAYCEKCVEVSECKKFKDYSHRINVLFKVGHGISCDK